jgi:hypothetical protein
MALIALSPRHANPALLPSSFLQNNYRLPTTDYRLPTTDYRSIIVSSAPRSNYSLGISLSFSASLGQGLAVMSESALEAVGCSPRSAK